MARGWGCGWGWGERSGKLYEKASCENVTTDASPSNIELGKFLSQLDNSFKSLFFLFVLLNREDSRNHYLTCPLTSDQLWP